MRTISTVIFDFDYTLADSSRGIIRCVDYALERLGLPAMPPERIRATIGLSLPDTLLALSGEENAHLAEDFRLLFQERADQVMEGNTFLLPSARETIERLRQEGVALGIVSTKFRYRIVHVLERERLMVFDAIVGGEDVPEHKPDPASLRLALEKLSSDTQRAIYVGDSVTDAEAAQRAGLPFVAVLSGVTPRDAFTPYDARAVLADVTGVPDLLW